MISDTLREWVELDKSQWGPGPWQSEPDNRTWVDAATRLPCAMVRAPVTGAWCGYVGLVPGHRAYRWAFEPKDPERRKGEKYREYMTRCWQARAQHTTGYAIIDEFVRCHGGLTWGSGSEGCHITAPRGYTRVRWLGFDCAHFMDVSPAIDALTARIMGPEHAQQRAALRALSADDWPTTYKDVAYVQASCEQLAADLNALGPRPTWRRPGADPIEEMRELVRHAQ